MIKSHMWEVPEMLEKADADIAMPAARTLTLKHGNFTHVQLHLRSLHRRSLSVPAKQLPNLAVEADSTSAS